MLDVVFSGLVLSSVYGLVAIGISLTWASIGMLNLAQGFIFTAGGYSAYLFSQVAADRGVSGPALSIGTVVAGMLGAAVFGLAVGGLAFLPLQDRDNFRTRSLIATLAISLIGTQVWLIIFGPQSKPLPQIFGDGVVQVGDASVTYGQLGGIVVAALTLAAVIMWMRSSRSGLQMRAMMMNPLGAAVVGVSVRTTGMRVLAISGALTGLSAVLLGQVFFVSPTSGVTPLTVGLIISLAGGLGSIPGTVVAAGLMGFAEAITARYLEQSYVPFVLFGLVVLILVFRPRGLGGLLEDVRE
ncbi:MAG: branched-chain amino acid ABC transporter permease [Actinomycetales bacterium]|nr:branched-chain amino acid ABC transporter permease [Actinomycetales bacterium]